MSLKFDFSQVRSKICTAFMSALFFNRLRLVDFLILITCFAHGQCGPVEYDPLFLYEATWLNGEEKAGTKAGVLGCLPWERYRKPSRTQSRTICSSCVGFQGCSSAKGGLVE